MTGITFSSSMTIYFPAMKWLRKLRHGKDEVPETPARPAAPRPVSVRQPAASPADKQEQDKDALKLGEESEDGVNPYDTQSWELDPEKNLRRVEDAKTVNRNRGQGDVSDPYNTGGFRKGW